ncbi:hypothetical protein Q5M87_09565 [Brachyspira innocens]|uniref:Uncharacterized protein n=1 Tax=Brachyspira innocens TaxID=13264 RepID=A0ABT8YU19_9SPIR|nr:hypothetical protein [Brachyspira innocens]MDO6994253.1 hypothetical protein [Brachyspira innocens]MDO7019328.1 hypothetical protein [Brachyspira innocens]
MNIESYPKWDNYYAETDENSEFQLDKTERPPLTGKNRYVSNGLYDEKWGNVYDAYGKANLTPYYIEALTSDDDNDVNFGVYGLYSATTHQGSVYKSSKMAVPYLADLLKFNNNASELACIFLSRIALGENHFINTPFFYKTKYYSTVKKYKYDIIDYYNKSNSLNAMRLLCFISKSLPKVLNVSYEECLKIENGNKTNAYIRQASTLLVQGFTAAQYNYKISDKNYYKEYPNIDMTDDSYKKLEVHNHIKEVYNIMKTSESLLVRGSAAICLAYTGVFYKDISDLLLYIAENNCAGVDWVWDDNFSNIAKHAWVYSCDIETLLNTEGIKTKNDMCIAGSVSNEKSYDDILIEAVVRVFPYKEKRNELINIELNNIQKRVLKIIIDKAPNLLGSYELETINMPLNIEAVKRLIDDNYIKNKILCKIISSKPLWYIIEEALIKKDEKTITDTIINKNIDALKLLYEIYTPIKNIVNREIIKNTLNIYTDLDKKILNEANTILLSSIADCIVYNIASYKNEIFNYLDETLIKVKDFKDDYDYSEKLTGEYVGVFLLALGRSKLLDEKYYILVRPFHRYVKYSSFPSKLFFELLNYTSLEHIEYIKNKFSIKIN